VPFLRHFVVEGAGQSFFYEDFLSDIEVKLFEERAVKRYTFSAFLKDHGMQADFLNEFGIMKQAADKKL
jgi:hypothetical protein